MKLTVQVVQFMVTFDFWLGEGDLLKTTVRDLVHYLTHNSSFLYFTFFNFTLTSGLWCDFCLFWLGEVSWDCPRSQILYEERYKYYVRL